jgi:archaellum biogenesis protein FlaJ (TadC family)
MQTGTQKESGEKMGDFVRKGIEVCKRRPQQVFEKILNSMVNFRKGYTSRSTTSIFFTDFEGVLPAEHQLKG